MGEQWDIRNWDYDEMPEELVGCEFDWQHSDKYDEDPRNYDWLKWEKDPAEADAFLAEHCTPRM